MQGGGLSKCSLLLLVAIEAIYAISLDWHDNCIYLACSLNFTARIWVSYVILPQLLQSWMNHPLLLKERIFSCIWGKATARLEARSPESEGGSNGICDVQAKPGGRWLSVFWVWVLRHKDDEKLHQVKKFSSFQFPYETSCVTILPMWSVIQTGGSIWFLQNTLIRIFLYSTFPPRSSKPYQASEILLQQGNVVKRTGEALLPIFAEDLAEEKMYHSTEGGRGERKI